MKTTGVSDIPKFGLLDFLGHPNAQVGKQKLASRQYNSPMAMYSEDVLEEIMQQVVTQQQE